MRSRVAAASLIASASLLAVGCGADEQRPPTAAGADPYVDRAGELMRPVGQMVSAIGRRAEGGSGPAPARAALHGIVRRAEAGLDAFRAVDPGDDRLRYQQARMAAEYGDVVAAMPPVADALADGRSGADLAPVAAPFFTAIERLSAAAEPGP
jgi:hypothetical protein